MCLSIFLSPTTDFPSLFVEYFPIASFSSYDFIDLLWSSKPLSPHVLFGLRLDYFKGFWKPLVIVLPFLSFKGIIHTCLLKISITHNKKQISLLNLLINCISTRSVPKILSMKGDCTFLFFNILIIGLCNSSIKSWF